MIWTFNNYFFICPLLNMSQSGLFARWIKRVLYRFVYLPSTAILHFKYPLPLLLNLMDRHTSWIVSLPPIIALIVMVPSGYNRIFRSFTTNSIIMWIYIIDIAHINFIMTQLMTQNVPKKKPPKVRNRNSGFYVRQLFRVSKIPVIQSLIRSLWEGAPYID